MLIDFLTSLLPESNIVDLTFKDKDQLGRTEEDRKAVYDIYCQNSSGEKIIVELQRANGATLRQNYFKDRTVYYSTFPIQEQAQKGDWNYELKYVYCVGILDFKFEEKIANGKGEVIHTVQLKDQNNKVFYEKLKFVYLEMPHFVKAEHEIVNRLDKWLYFIKHLEDFQSIPEVFKDEVFVQAFEKAEIAKYSEAERHDYEQSLKIFRDNKAVFEYAINTAFDEGKQEGKLEVARKMKHKGLASSDISDLTGLSEEEINDL